MSHDHLAEPDYGTGKKTLKIYIIGLLLCVVLTLIPFIAVFVHSAPSPFTKDFAWLINLFPGKDNWSVNFIYALIFICAIVQFVVQVVCFLRLNTETAQGKSNIYSFVFTLLIVFVLVGGTMWIMYTLHGRMMGSGGNMTHMTFVKKA